ncbi:MAG: hypothetical protein EA376_09870 [Phycisphaeraceae bacterium]|nr:MAG: hypothetical protein EA376_09870 [Phycisphaeraceae bacterium]
MIRTIRKFFAPVFAALVGMSVLASPALADATVGWVELKGAPSERPDPFATFASPDSKRKTLREVIEIFDKAARRPDLDAVVLRLRQPTLNVAQAQEIGAKIEEVRRSGKTVHLFTEIYGPVELILGSYADEIIVQSGGMISFPGLYMEEMFLADTLSMIGVKADMVQVGDYKGAAEMMSNREPSPEWDENISQLLDSMYGQMRGRIMKGRGYTDAQMDAVMEKAWMATPEEAMAMGLVDAVIDRMDVEAHLQERFGDFDYAMDLEPDRPKSPFDTANPFALFRTLMDPPDRRIRPSSIALVHINGPIVDGESSEGGLFGGGAVGSLTVREALAKIKAEPNIEGVIIRIESPGGSAIASESIWLGVRQLAEEKPVWVSVGSMAASGGYYIAVGGDRIYVNPVSIVGSIGVVGGKYTMGGLYQMGRVNVTPRTRGPRADLFSTLKPWSDAERALVRDRMTVIYDQFVDRVKMGRPDIDIDKTAEGRLFTGDRAVELKMADKIGGVEMAITDMADHLGFQHGRYHVVPYPEPKTITQMLESMFGGVISAPGVEDRRGGLIAGEIGAALRELVGPRAWPALRDSLNAMHEMRREPVLLTMPRILLMP